MTSEKARPNIEVPKAVPIPESGALSPAWRSLNSAETSPACVLRLAITPETAPTVSSRPQKVPSRPRKIRRPIT